MRKMIKLFALVLAVAFTVACSSQKGPAEAALKAAETAWASVSAEATKYVPDLAKGIEDALKAAKDAMAKGDYATAIKDAGPIPGQIADLQKTIEQKKNEWAAAWRTLDSAIGSAMTAVQGKVDELAKAKKLPKGVEKDAVEAAKAGLASAQQTIDEAKQMFRDGNYDVALGKANAVKRELAKIVTDLKLDMPLLADIGKPLADAATETIKEPAKK